MSFNEGSEELAFKTVSSLNCDNYLMQYKNCLENADGKKRRLKECARLMNQFRFCLAEMSIDRSKQKVASETTRLD